MEVQLARLMRAAPDAAGVARQGYQPLMSEAGQRVQVAQQVEQAVVEIANSGNGNRLANVVISETGREEAFLMENQLARQGVQLLPNSISSGRQLMSQIARMPINAEDAKNLMREIATKGSVAVGTATAAARAGGAAARSWLSVAAESVGTFLVAFGSRLISVPLLIIPLNPGSDKEA
jgi:hypothetical protein